MINALILEDDSHIALREKLLLEEHFNQITVHIAHDWDAAMQFVRRDVLIQLFLLDIDLKTDDTHDGIAFAEYLRSRKEYEIVPIVYITSIQAKLHTALNRTHCYSFLFKPYSDDDFLHTVDELLRSPHMEQSFLECVDTLGVYCRLDPQDIRCILSDKHCLHYYTSTSVVTSREYSLSDIEVMYPSIFLRCHKRYLVNLHFISDCDLTTRWIHLSPINRRLDIPIGRHYQNIVKEALFHD